MPQKFLNSSFWGGEPAIRGHPGRPDDVPRGRGRGRVRHAGAAPGRPARGRLSDGHKLAKFAKFCKFLAGSFSAVSKRNFARKYAFDSIFQALQDYLAEFFEIWQKFADFATFANFFCINLDENC